MIGKKGIRISDAGIEEGRRDHHLHAAADPALLAAERGIRAVKLSFLALAATALIQVAIVFFSGSVALLADTVHNFGDAATALPLWVAFRLGRLPPTKGFTYGYGRAEDLAGLAIVLVIVAGAVFTGYESVMRLYEPASVGILWAVALASIMGFVGNEAVAVYRMKVGREINSAALVADGLHARADGLTSLAVLFGAVGVWAGYPRADPLVGLIITVVILHIGWRSGRMVLTRLVDGVDPEVVDGVRAAAGSAPGVEEVSGVRVRWLGHRLRAEIDVIVDPDLTVEEGHKIAKEVGHQLLRSLPYLSEATVHVDPPGAPGEAYHRNHHGDDHQDDHRDEGSPTGRRVRRP
ncbi:cation diffusion facilitator family transporter [Methanotrichaceae archaeon M04Ac]|uniref:Cation diffusion facilitator family transporter n=1 Tax=Candidatus Methanocrinis alkalitolerans TaxID=3033395 RepID=A0ABT5XGE1_9EURY|nr:cation diffusion facilitator family transporter [Candidatus Methanocrinis alkalitolerans]MCR3883725.1 cation diffusion facilitator family transporter [Methanothrix sp.]MDF0593783.1 cation diffusion facilitator family transporter [Candidatus Methanocrinis alkalitolerans]